MVSHWTTRQVPQIFLKCRDCSGAREHLRWICSMFRVDSGAPGSTTYWLCDPRRVINFSCLSIFLCEMETIMVPGSYNYVRIDILGTSLVVQWLRLCRSSVGDASSIPGWGTKIPYAPICGPKKLLYHNCLIC